MIAVNLNREKEHSFWPICKTSTLYCRKSFSRINWSSLLRKTKT